ncbi:SWIM zinc finger family protein [Sinorhizobium fredii]|nr:DUF6880 family protein [Sinorhizobium fredii]
MSPENKVYFNVDALRELVGKTVFARGEAYFREDRVELLAIKPERVLARVKGTESYRVELTGQGRAFGGDCTCVAFDDRGSCKHMVAVALAANAGGGEAGQDGTGTFARIRAHLQAKSIDALVDMIMEIAEFDSDLLHRLDMAALATDGDSKTIEKHLRRAIDSATQIDDYVGYREAAGWAADVHRVLNVVAELPGKGHGELALQLAEHTFDRIQDAMENIDDSDGHCSTLLDRTRDIHLAAARAVRPDPVLLARDLFKREMEGEYDTFYNAAGTYADILGDEGLAEYRRLALAAWEKLPPLRGGGGTRSRTAYTADYSQLRRILDTVGADERNIEARIALRTKDLSSPWNYLELAGFCRKNDREEQALRWAEEGLWIFEDERPDAQLVFIAVELLTKIGRATDAAQHLWRAFRKVPNFEIYLKLRELEGEAVCDSAVQTIESQLAGGKDAGLYAPYDLLMRILMHEERFDAAWAVSSRRGVSTGMRQTLADASAATHPEQAVRVYAEKIEQLVNLSGNHNYEEAARLIDRIGGLRSAGEHADYVESLKTRHGRRRNFMKLLG